jgi:hypothetical protein
MRDGDHVVGLAHALVEEKGGQGEEREMGTAGSVSRLEFIPSVQAICGEGCGKRGRGRGGGLGTLERGRVLRSGLLAGKGVHLWSRVLVFHPSVVVGQAKRRTGGSR